MLKRWFDLSSNRNGHAADVEQRNGSSEAPPPVLIAVQEEAPPVRLAPPTPAPDRAEAPETDVNFEQIYHRAGIAPSACGILKVVEMMHSPHLAGMSSEGKRCALRMALEAVGASVEGVLQDGVARQGVLNAYEKEQQDKLRRFEERKADENRRLQAELDRLTHDFMTRMQAGMDEVSREQDNFRGWQKRKQLELQKIADAAGLCVPESMGSHGIGLSAVLERACATRA
jgi:hypothetical protein